MNNSQNRSPRSIPGSHTRRQFLRHAALGATLLSGAGLLAACGGPPPSQQQAAQPTAATASQSAPATTGSPAAAAVSSPVAASAPPTAQPSTARSSGAAASPVAANSAPAAPLAARPGGEMTYALAGKFDGLDPSVTTSTICGRMTFHLFDQLVREPKPGVFVPGLAEKWEVNPTADEYTFSLRKDVKFHDGTPFNGDAVKATFDRIVNPEMKSQLALSLIGPYDSTTVVDPYTVKVKFKSPYAPFLDSAAQPFLSIMSPAAIDKYGKDINVNPVGTGPYKFESYQIDNVVRMVKNPDYAWGPSFFQHKGAPFIDAINWRIIGDPATRVAALKAGEVTFIEDLPVSNYQEMQGNPTYQIVEGTQAGSGYSMMINVTRPPTDDVKVRQAISWAIDRQALVKTVWNGLFPVACSVLTSVTFGYDPATCQVYGYDPKKAGDLLDQAGWKLDGDVRKKDGKELSIALYFRADQQVNVGQATFLQAALGAIGMKVEMNGLAQAGYFDAVRRGDHNMQPWWGPATDPDVVRQYYYSKNADGGTNRSRYKNPEMDTMIDQAAGYTDPEKRKQAYAAIQKKVLDEAIMVFIADSKNLYTANKTKLSDVSLDWSSSYPLFYDASMTS
jgi:peptide/nickel transport system substrate-binding protein